MSLYWGLLLGVSLCLGMAFLRARHLQTARVLGWFGGSLMGLILLFGVPSLAYKTWEGGSDVGMNSLMWLMLLLITAATLLAFMGLAALLQSKAFGISGRAIFLSTCVEPLVALMVIASYASSVTAPAQRKLLDDWMAVDIAQKAKVAELEKAVPAKYRDYHVPQLDSQKATEKMVTDKGGKIKPYFPPEVDAAIRARDAFGQGSNPPVSGQYQALTAQLTELEEGLLGSVGLGMLVIPWMFRGKGNRE